MAKPQAPRWLTQSFADGVVEQMSLRPTPAYKGALGRCLLAQHDHLLRPCRGRLERAHLIPRQRVENALAALLPYVVDLAFNEDGSIDIDGPPPAVDSSGRIAGPPPIAEDWRNELILLAAWDPRNGVIACEGHHRRFDSHLTPALTVRRDCLPTHLIEFASDWGIEGQLDRFPSAI